MNWTNFANASFLSELITVTLKGSFLLGVGVLVGLHFKKASASSRHFLMSALVITVSILPLLAYMLPDLTLPVPGIIRSQPESEIVLQKPLMENFDARRSDLPKIPISVSGPDSLPASSHGLDFLLYLWLLGSAVAAGRVAAGVVVCARNRREARPLSSKRIGFLVNEFSRRIGLRKSPVVMISDRIEVAYVNGMIRPVLFLPFHITSWPEERLSSLLLHELAHIKRKDHISWPLLNLVAAWLWFNPLLWIVMDRIRRDKERACDDYAISNGYGRNRYARHLLEVYISLKSPERQAVLDLSFARKNQVKERIIYMLNHGIDRRPMSRAKQLAIGILLVILTLPLMSIKGFSSNVVLKDVTPQERDEVSSLLGSFYSALSNGSDYHATKERYLTSDYFDDPVLTLENLDRAVRRPPFDNTLRLISDAGVAPAKKVSSRITAIKRDGDELVVTQTIDVISDRIRGEIKHDDDGVTIIRVPKSDSEEGSGIDDCYLVKSLTQQIRFRREDDDWKISKFNDGVTLMRMDTDNPYGPIFLFWMKNIDAQTTPFGAGIFKVFPHDIIPDARNTEFVLEK